MTSLKGLEYQQLTMEKILKQLILNESMLSNGSKFKVQCETILQIIGNMREG